LIENCFPRTCKLTETAFTGRTNPHNTDRALALLAFILPCLVDMVGDTEPLMPTDDAAVMRTAAEAAMVGGVRRRPVLPPTVTSLTLALRLARLIQSTHPTNSL